MGGGISDPTSGKAQTPPVEKLNPPVEKLNPPVEKLSLR